MKCFKTKIRLGQVMFTAFILLSFVATSLLGQTHYDCSQLPEWDSTLVYASKTTVQYNLKVYENKWWTQDENPEKSGQWGVWNYLGDCTVVVAPPAAPSHLVAVAASNIQIDISWADHSTNEFLFRIQRSVDGISWADVATVPANSTAYSNTGLIASRTYYYRVRAENEAGNSDFSNTANATTHAGGTAPVAPDALGAIAISSSQIDISWSDNSTTEDLFRIQSSADGTAWGDITTVDANVATYSHTGLTANTAYYYRVRAENANGNSAYSNSATATTTGGGGSCDGLPVYPAGRGSYIAGDRVQNMDKVFEVRAWPREAWANSTSAAYVPGVGEAWEDAWLYISDCSSTPEPPAAPTALSATAISASRISINWTDNSNNEELFRIEQSANGTSGWTSVGTVSADVAGFANSGLTPLTTYYYRVRAENTYGNSVYSNVSSATTPDNSSTDLPDRVVVGYWHNWNAASQGGYIRLVDVPDYYNVIVVAFVEKVGEDGTVRFVPDTEVVSEAQFRADIAAAKTAGKKILISIGGQNNHLILANATMRDNFTNSMISTIENWGFDGLDIDLESSSMVLAPGDTDLNNPTTPGIVNLIASCRAIYNHFGPGFMLTAAPETAHVQGGYGSYSSVYGAYLPWLHKLRDILTYVHVQYYNSGTMNGLDGGIYSVGTADFIVAMTEMLTLGFPIAGDTNNMFPPLREDQVAFGIPCAPGAAGTGYTPAAEVNKALDYLMTGNSFGGRYVLQNPTGYCNLRGAMTWSINWDYMENGASYAWARDVSNKLTAIPACLKSAQVSAVANDIESVVAIRNYPNPFDAETNIEFSIKKESDVTVKVFNSFGNEVALLLNKRLEAGSHTILFNGSGFSTGTYYYQVVIGDTIETGLMIKK